MIYDNLNNHTNLHKHNHDQQPNCGAAWLSWGTERIENRNYSRPQILDFHIPLLPCNHSHGYWAHWHKNPINWQNIPMSNHLAVKPTWLFLSNKKKWGVRFWAPYCRSQILLRSSMHGHKNWSTAMTIAQKIWKYIPTTDDPAVKPAWLF